MRHTWQSMTSDERAESVLKYALQGLSARGIAEMIPGATRNAIIGMADRRGIALLGGKGGKLKRSDRERKPENKPKATVVSIVDRPRKTKKPVSEGDTAEIIELKPPEKRVGGPLKLFELTRTTCRGPLNESYRGLDPDEMMFCGEVTRPESSWCEKCAKKYVTGRVPVKKIVDKNGDPVKASSRKRAPFHRWLR